MSLSVPPEPRTRASSVRDKLRGGGQFRSKKVRISSNKRTLMKLNIVYEDADLLVLNKPSGISMHKTHINDQHETIADLLIKQYPFLKDVGEDLLRPGIVHRLDKETSGLVIIAKNNPTFSYLKNLFQERKMIKHYVALVYGHPHNPEGIINVPLGKLGTKQTTQLKGKKDLTVRDAITEYRTL